MFEYFRQEKSGTAVKAVLFLLVLSFMLWGVHGLFNNNSELIYSANGIEISKSEFNASYHDNKRYGLSAEDILRQLVGKKMMLAKLEKQGFAIDQDGVIQQVNFGLMATKPNWPSIEKINAKAFQTSKHFIIQKLTDANVSEAELKQFFARNNSNYLTDLSVVLTKRYFNKQHELKPKIAELLDFYHKHIDWYTKPGVIKAKVYKVIPGINPSKFAFLNSDQLQELAANKQTLAEQGNRSFPADTTNPGVFQLLNSLKPGDAEFVNLNGVESIVKIESKQALVQAKFPAIKAKVMADYVNFQNKQITDIARDAFKTGLVNNFPVVTSNNTLSELAHYGDKDWFLNKDNIGKSKYFEDDNTIELITLEKIVPKKIAELSQVHQQVKQDLMQEKLIIKAKSIIANGTISGKEFIINSNSNDVYGVPASELMQMQFKDGADKKFFKSNKSIVLAKLTGFTDKNKLVYPSELKQSYVNDVMRLFVNQD